MVKVFIRRNLTTPTGYELVDGNVVKPIVKSGVEKKTGILWLSLPENSTGRTLANEAKVKAADGNYELKSKADRSTTSTTTPKVSRLEEDAKAYLSEDEYKTFTKLMAKIEYNRQVKALEAEIKALEAKKQELLKGGND